MTEDPPKEDLLEKYQLEQKKRLWSEESRALCPLLKLIEPPHHDVHRQYSLKDLEKNIDANDLFLSTSLQLRGAFLKTLAGNPNETIRIPTMQYFADLLCRSNENILKNLSTPQIKALIGKGEWAPMIATVFNDDYLLENPSKLSDVKPNSTTRYCEFVLCHHGANHPHWIILYFTQAIPDPSPPDFSHENYYITVIDPLGIIQTKEDLFHQITEICQQHLNNGNDTPLKNFLLLFRSAPIRGLWMIENWCDYVARGIPIPVHISAPLPSTVLTDPINFPPPVGAPIPPNIKIFFPRLKRRLAPEDWMYSGDLCIYYAANYLYAGTTHIVSKSGTPPPPLPFSKKNNLETVQDIRKAVLHYALYPGRTSIHDFGLLHSKLLYYDPKLPVTSQTEVFKESEFGNLRTSNKDMVRGSFATITIWCQLIQKYNIKNKIKGACFNYNFDTVVDLDSIITTAETTPNFLIGGIIATILPNQTAGHAISFTCRPTKTGKHVYLLDSSGAGTNRGRGINYYLSNGNGSVYTKIFLRRGYDFIDLPSVNSYQTEQRSCAIWSCWAIYYLFVLTSDITSTIPPKLTVPLPIFSEFLYKCIANEEIPKPPEEYFHKIQDANSRTTPYTPTTPDEEENWFERYIKPVLTKYFFRYLRL